MESKVVKFPKKPVRKIPANEPANDSFPQEPGKSKALAGLKGAGRVLQFVIFMAMYWVRWLVVGACSIISVVMLLAWLFALYAFPDKTNMVWAFGSVSLISFVIAWFYDFVLMKLSPTQMVDTL